MSFGLRIKMDKLPQWPWCNLKLMHLSSVQHSCLEFEVETTVDHMINSLQQIEYLTIQVTVFCLLNLINNIQIFCLVLRTPYNPYQCVTLNQEQTPLKGIYACFRLHTFVAVYLFTFALCFLSLSFLVSDHQCREQEAPTSSLKSITWSVLLR